MRETTKKLSKLKSSEVEKLIQRKEEEEHAPNPNNIYENSTMFKRETVEARMEKIQALMQD